MFSLFSAARLSRFGATVPRSVLHHAQVMLLAGLGAAVFTACSPSEEDLLADNLIYNSFDNLAGWTPPNPTLTTDFAHSGRYSIKAGPGHEYSYGYTRLVGEITAKRFHRVRLSGWAYLPTKDAGAVTVCFSLYNTTPTLQEVFGANFALSDQVKVEREWTEVSKEITVPATMTFMNELRIFLFRHNASAPAYFDDLRVEVLD